MNGAIGYSMIKSKIYVLNINNRNMTRSRMNQFHMEPNEGGFVKSPNWSLGKYSRTIVVRRNGDFLNDSAPIMKVNQIHSNFHILNLKFLKLALQVIDFFVDGQRCDETNRGRSTEVHIQCCEGMALQNFVPVSHYISHVDNIYLRENVGPYVVPQ